MCEDDEDYCGFRIRKNRPQGRGQGILPGGCVQNIQTYPRWFHNPPAEIPVLVFETNPGLATQLIVGIRRFGHSEVRHVISWVRLGYILCGSPEPIIVCDLDHLIINRCNDLLVLLRTARKLSNCQLLFIGGVESIDAFFREAPIGLACNLALHDLTFCDKLTLDGIDVAEAAKTAMAVFASRRAEAIQVDSIAEAYRI
jgi:hypothetical protein